MIRLGLVLLAVPAVLLMGFYLSEFAQVDACLEQGGSFDYTQSRCDLDQQHPFIPFLARYPLWVNSAMLLMGAGCLLSLVGLYRRS